VFASGAFGGWTVGRDVKTQRPTHTLCFTRLVGCCACGAVGWELYVSHHVVSPQLHAPVLRMLLLLASADAVVAAAIQVCRIVCGTWSCWCCGADMCPVQHDGSGCCMLSTVPALAELGCEGAPAISCWCCRALFCDARMASGCAVVGRGSTWCGEPMAVWHDLLAA
jgi:hypothetical protein